MKIHDDKGYGQGFALTPTVAVRIERRCDYILDRIQAGPETRIVELGCGTGYMAYLMAEKSGATVIGTDICEPFLEEANQSFQLPNLSFEFLNCELLDSFEHFSRVAPVDCFVGNGILHHVHTNMDSVLRQLYDYLPAGGKLVFIEPNVYNPACYLIHYLPVLRRWRRLDPAERAFSKRFIEKKLKAAGFGEIRVDFKDFLVPFIPFSLVKPVVFIGDVAEGLPLLKMLSQSIFISAEKT